MSADLFHLAPTLRECCVAHVRQCEEAGLDMKVIQTFRSIEEQAKKFRCTRSLKDILDRSHRLAERGRPDLAELLMTVGPQKRPDWLPEGHLTLAACGESKHHKMILQPYAEPYSFAYDVACFDHAGKYITDGNAPEYQLAGKIGKLQGLQWLGDSERFKEAAHFQMAGLPPTIDRLRAVVE